MSIEGKILRLRMRRSKTLHDINERVIEDLDSSMNRLMTNPNRSKELQQVYDKINGKTIAEIKSLCLNYENDSFQIKQLEVELPNKQRSTQE